MSHLYRHFDKDNRLLYVGISLHAFKRFTQHQSTARWFDQIVKMTIDQYPMWDAAVRAERIAIKMEHPLYNIAHVEAPLDDWREEMAKCWNMISEVEPRLWQMYIRAVQVNDNPVCANKIWFDEFKPELLGLVGWEATHPSLKSEWAYDVAYQTIYAALPDCGEHCGHLE